MIEERELLDSMQDAYRLRKQLSIALKALGEIANDPHCDYSVVAGGGSYGTGVADGHRCAAKKARTAIAKIKGGDEQRTDT